MCGRYNFKTSDSRKGKQLKERARKLNLTYKEGEIFPSDNVLCIIPAESKIDHHEVGHTEPFLSDQCPRGVPQ